MLREKFSKLWYLVGILAAANLAIWFGGLASKPDYLGLQFFDVGQGDAIYLRTPQGNDILIDGGPGDAVLAKLGQVMPFADRTIELVILTHPHADHVSGLAEVLKRYRVKNIIFPGVVYESATYARFLELIKEKNVLVHIPHLADRVLLDDFTVLDLYYPITGEFSRNPSDINDVSIIGKLSYGTNRVMFTGDAGKNIENFLLKLGVPLESNILKVGHHGSRHSTAAEFLAAVKPEYSVISVGKENKYGHPHEEVLGVLKAANTEILRTDQQGDIIFRLFPQNMQYYAHDKP